MFQKENNKPTLKLVFSVIHLTYIDVLIFVVHVNVLQDTEDKF